jgi:peptide/nickel transport system substrate-binding protein
MKLSILRNPAVLISILLVFIVACGSSATATSVPATSPPPPTASTGGGAPTAMPEPTETPPASAVSSASLHVALTPLPQVTYFPWLGSVSGNLPHRPITENGTTMDPKTGVSVIYPELFTDWEISPDGRDYSITIREGVKFHNGWGEYTVKDFINSIDMYTTAEVDLTGCGATVKAFMGADSATAMKEAGNLTVIDDYNFSMSLARPQVDLLTWWFNNLMGPCGQGWSSDQWAEEGESMFETGPSGTGAYRFVDRKLKESITYERVPYDHWRVTPEFENLKISPVPEDATRLALLLTGEADMVDVPKVLFDQATDAGMVVFESPLHAVGLTVILLGIYHVSEVNWNPEDEPWTRKGEEGRLVREAMNRAINREEIIRVLFKGRGDPMYNTIFHQSLEGWNPRWETDFEENYGYDPELAKQLLDQAGLPGDSNGENRFRVEIRQSSLPGLPEAIEAAQATMQAFRDVGIDAHLVSTEFGIALESFRDKHDAHFILPVRQTIRPLSANMRIYNYTGPIDPERGRPTQGVIYSESEVADRVYEQMLIETDPDVRNTISQELGDYNYDNYLTIPVVNIKATIVGNPDVVDTYSFGGITGVFTHMEYITAAR